MIEGLKPAEPTYLTVQDVAEYTGTTTKFWNKLRSEGGGPLYAKLSAKAIRYRRADIDAWMAERMRRSTFDGGKVAA